jgi:hypothetical protein
MPPELVHFRGANVKMLGYISAAKVNRRVVVHMLSLHLFIC